AIRRGGLVLDRLQAHHGGDPHPTARDLRSTHHVRDRQKDDGEVPRRTVSERGRSGAGAGGGRGLRRCRARDRRHQSHPPARARPVPPGTPGRLTLQGLPAGARVTLNGMPFRGSQQDVPPGTYTLAVRASGFAPYDRLVVVLPGAPSTVRLELQPLTVSRE